MKMERDDPRLIFMPLDKVLEATGPVMAIRNVWWSVCPERGLIFYQTNPRRKGALRGSSPQYNATRDIAESIQNKLYPWAETRLVPIVLYPIDLSDYV